jgi:purine-binding chemotaxis protein CheW
MSISPSRSDGSIDWAAIREQLERWQAAGRASSAQEAGAVLQARARALAKVPAVPPDASEVLTVVRFDLGDEPYAIEARHVRRVVRIDDRSVTPIPGTPEFLAGVINMAGEILAVFDLGRLLGIPRGARSAPAHVLVLGNDDDELGLLADSAHEVASLRIDALLEAPGSLEGFGRDILRGVTADALIVLDGAALLRDPRLFIDQPEESLS